MAKTVTRIKPVKTFQWKVYDVCVFDWGGEPTAVATYVGDRKAAIREAKEVSEYDHDPQSGRKVRRRKAVRACVMMGVEKIVVDVRKVDGQTCYYWEGGLVGRKVDGEDVVSIEDVWETRGERTYCPEIIFTAGGQG